MRSLTMSLLLYSLLPAILVSPLIADQGTVNTVSAKTELNPTQVINTKQLTKDNKVEPATTVYFTPPPGWMSADPKTLPTTIKAMVIGKSKSNFPPSINLGLEQYNGTLKQYLKTIKTINESQGTEWKDLGKVSTLAGEASLSQVDVVTEWGDVRMMHVILLHDGMIYIMTAAALKSEFSDFYKLFFESMKSIRFTEKA